MKVIKILFCCVIFHQFCIAQPADSIKPVRQKVLVTIYPNPAKHKATFRLSNYDAGAVQVQITDVNGILVYNEKRLVVLQEDEITIFFQFKKGNYWCVIRQKDKQAKAQLSIIE